MRNDLVARFGDGNFVGRENIPPRFNDIGITFGGKSTSGGLGYYRMHLLKRASVPLRYFLSNQRRTVYLPKRYQKESFKEKGVMIIIT